MITMCFRLTVDLPDSIAHEIASMSEAEVQKRAMAALELYFSSQDKLPLTSKKGPEEIMRGALLFWDKVHRPRELTLPPIPPPPARQMMGRVKGGRR